MLQMLVVESHDVEQSFLVSNLGKKCWQLQLVPALDILPAALAGCRMSITQLAAFSFTSPPAALVPTRIPSFGLTWHQLNPETMGTGRTTVQCGKFQNSVPGHS